MNVRTTNEAVRFTLLAAWILASGCGASSSDVASAEVKGAGNATAASPVNLVANPSFETVLATRAAALPASWTTGSWGTNTVSYRYDDADAHSGGRSARIDITSYTSGDAKWIFDAVPVTAGTKLLFRDYYKASVATKVVAVYQQSNGTVTYETLGVPPLRETWDTFAVAFTPPAGTSRVTVYHLIAAVGSLQIDDVSLSLPPAVDLSTGVPNGSLEQGSDLELSKPLGWLNATTGSSTAVFGYSTAGRGGSYGLTVVVSSWASGDAKWYFDPQPVVAGTRYLYSDNYQSTSPHFLTARVTMSNGTFTYFGLGSLAASSDWALAQVAFVIPSGGVAVTVFHGLACNGTLRIDDVALSVLPSAPIVNGVPNGDLELPAYPSADLPAAWHPNVWGTNVATFSYPAGGHTGSRCVRVDVASLSSGAASWYFDPQPVDPAVPYAAGFYYRSGTDIAVLATVTLSDGTNVNLQLPPALGAASWTAYSTRISLPVNAVAATIYYKLSRAGWAEIDDASLLQTTTVPFVRALASVTFDDAWLTDYTNALPVLQKHQVNATHYVITGLLENPNRLSVDMLAALQAGGDEIGSHTVDHADLTSLSSADLDYELSQSKQFLAANGFGQVQDFASPYGAYNGPALAAIETYYRSHRTVDVGYNTKGDLDPYRLKVQNINSTVTAAQVDAWAAQAAADRSWLILVYHDVVSDPSQGTAYSTTPALLDAQLAALQAHDLPVLTIQKALDEVLPQVQAP